MSNDVKLDCAETTFTLGSLQQDLDKLHTQFNTLVSHANNAGAAKISSTLYKMIQDVEYLREVGPNIVAALSEKF